MSHTNNKHALETNTTMLYTRGNQLK